MSFSNDSQEESGSNREDRWGGIGGAEKKRVLAILAEDGSSHSAPTTGDSPGDPVPSLAPAGTHTDV